MSQLECFLLKEVYGCISEVSFKIQILCILAKLNDITYQTCKQVLLCEFHILSLRCVCTLLISYGTCLKKVPVSYS